MSVPDDRIPTEDAEPRVIAYDEPGINWSRLLISLFIIVVIILIGLLIWSLTRDNHGDSNDNSDITEVELGASIVKCENVAVITSFPYDILKNQDDGDPYYWSVDYAWDTVDEDTWFVAIIEIGHNLDFENPEISGKSWKLEGTQAGVVCFAESLANSPDHDVYQLYVGTQDTPDGWNTEFPEGWTMKTWAYEEAPVQTEAEFRDFPVTVGEKHVIGDSDEWAYGQLWSPDAPGTAQHPLVWPGYTLTVPSNFQGTGWYATGFELDRWNQAVREVESRDSAQVYKAFCGPANETPEDWMSPSEWSELGLFGGWTCQAQ